MKSGDNDMGKGTVADAFHRGEQQLQERVGSRAMLARNGHRIIQPQLTQQQQAFFQALPYVAIAYEDDTGRLKPTLLYGQAGFIQVLGAARIKIDTHSHREDSPTGILQAGAHIGLLGIDLATRRRNRINGRIHQYDDHALYIDVDQAFGNCPKYIQQRHLVHDTTLVAQAPTSRQSHEQLTPRLAETIRQADTCFIASRSLGLSSSHAVADNACGIDISHRGGHPGFIHILDEQTLRLPDYPGNKFFNTLGNLLEDPTAGLLIIDFEAGHTLQLMGRCEIELGPPQADWPAGAERLLLFRLQEAVFRENALPLRWRFDKYSPYLSFKTS